MSAKVKLNLNKIEIKATSKDKDTNNPCSKKNLMLTSNNGLAMLAKGLGKIASKIGFFVEYSQRGSLKSKC